jgi:hypothetical protein
VDATSSKFAFLYYNKASYNWRSSCVITIPFPNGSTSATFHRCQPTPPFHLIFPCKLFKTRNVNRSSILRSSPGFAFQLFAVSFLELFAAALNSSCRLHIGLEQTVLNRVPTVGAQNTYRRRYGGLLRAAAAPRCQELAWRSAENHNSHFTSDSCVSKGVNVWSSRVGWVWARQTGCVGLIEDFSSSRLILLVFQLICAIIPP